MKTEPRLVKGSELDLSFVDAVVERLGDEEERAIPILQALQNHYRYLPPEALQRVGALTGISAAALTGVSTFYAQFRHKPMGRHHVKVCNGTACHIQGAERVHEAMAEHLGLAEGADTDAAGVFTLEKVFCVGCCTLAPVVQIDGESHARLSRETAPDLLESFLKRSAPKRRASKAGRRTMREPLGEVRICLDSCCVARGCGKTHEALKEAVASGALRAKIKQVGCVVMCDRSPLVEVAVNGASPRQYSGVEAGSVGRLLEDHFKAGGLMPWLRRGASRALDWLSGESRPAIDQQTLETPSEAVAAFFGPQRHIATEHFGTLDPLDLDDYMAHEGFAALMSCVRERRPEEILNQVEASGLRGRGGAGFPTARKWRVVAATPADQRYVICNGDEGDPGAFMDRMLMESFPFRVIEGMAIAARAVGACKGFFYVRAEYPSAVARLKEAISICRERGVLGESVMGSDVSLELEVFEGAGAFVCGEETAMLESMEGRRGIPRLKPPYPAESGYHGKPTLINNVETYANVPWIIRHGGAAFAEVGSEGSKGTKVFALAGKVKRGGLIEVPMGVTIRQVVEEIGGGTPSGGPFKAVLVGGPSGGCVPESLANTPIDYESLAEVGAIMGPGGLIVLDQSDCMVQMARYFLDFCQCESCGKCTFCRVGTRRMLDILDRLCAGKGRKGDIDQLEELAGMVGKASLCGLGKTAPNPVRSALRFFRSEFEAHLRGECPAGACRELIEYSISDKCVGCTVCAQHCPVDAIPMVPYQRHVIDSSLCTRCDTCRIVCPEDAVFVR